MADKFGTLKTTMLKNAAVRAEYDRLQPEFEIARALIAARAHAGLSQDALARRMQTTQSAIARLESGRALPSTRTLKRYAAATGTDLRVTFVAKKPARQGKAERRAAARR